MPGVISINFTITSKRQVVVTVAGDSERRARALVAKSTLAPAASDHGPAWTVMKRFRGAITSQTRHAAC